MMDKGRHFWQVGGNHEGLNEEMLNRLFGPLPLVGRKYRLVHHKLEENNSKGGSVYSEAIGALKAIGRYDDNLHSLTAIKAATFLHKC